MERPNARLIIVSLFSLAAGYVIAWWIMAGLLGTQLRLFGFLNLSIIAILVAFVLIILLDSPLKLRAFNWAWPEGGLAWPESKKEKSGPSLVTRIANSLKVAAFVVVVVVLIAGFASLIPQVESPAPEALEISGALSGPELAQVGEEVFQSPEAGCLACHGLGREGLRAPDLAGIGARAAEREPGKSAEEYLREAFEMPCAYVVEGYDCIMPPTLVQALGPAKITAVIAFLQSQGGEITVSLSGEEAAEGSTAAAGAGGGAAGVAGTTAEEIITNLGCAACHQIDAIGAAGAVGPNLSEVGARLSPDKIRESILTPDAVVAEECPTGACPTGVMPKIYGDQLSAAQLETLVGFLSNLGGPAEEAGGGSN
ncbi:MAG TPA: cytochrome c [Anaerolineae bacterium]|nr:cytochrome c [Anaerolineae bacterium]